MIKNFFILLIALVLEIALVSFIGNYLQVNPTAPKPVLIELSLDSAPTSLPPKVKAPPPEKKVLTPTPKPMPEPEPKPVIKKVEEKPKLKVVKKPLPKVNKPKPKRIKKIQPKLVKKPLLAPPKALVKKISRELPNEFSRKPVPKTTEENGIKHKVVSDSKEKNTNSESSIATDPKTTLSNALEIKSNQEYLKRIFTIIARNKKYPSLARRRGIEGTVMVEFSVNQQGKPIGIKNTNKASSQLVKAAINTIKRGRFPTPPDSWDPNARIEIPMKYSLR